MSYVVPIHRPSGVRNALKLCFLNPNDDTLVVAKANRLEIYEQAQDGYALVHTTSVYGYITMLERLRPTSAQTDHLFVGTDRYQYFTCSWDSSSRQIKTEQSYVDQADKVLRDSRDMDRCHIDPTRRFMSLELYDGVVTVVPIEQTSNKRVKRESASGSRLGNLGEPTQVRIEELVTRSSAFVQTEPEDKGNPRLAILWEDNQEIPQLKIRELKYSSGDSPSAELETVAELRKDLDLGVSHLIPIIAPHGGFLILGERSISYVDSGLKRFISRDFDDTATIWSCWTKVDDERFLLADDYGRLFFLMIETGEVGVTGWQLDSVGSASRASCLVYLDEGFVFVGSHSGDSQIVQIVPGGVSVVQTFSNIAPILDLSIMDLGRGAEGGPSNDFSSGQARIVTASGAWQDGSIRGVRSGVGMEELGTIAELSHITEMWALSSTGAEDLQDTLVVTFVNETKVLRFGADESLEELNDFVNFDLTQSTLYAATLPDGRALQVSEGRVRIAEIESNMLLTEWEPPDSEAKITAAAANSVHLLVVEGGHTLHVFHTAQNDSKPTKSKTFPSTSQISGVTVPESQSNVCIVSFWQTATVAILDLHSLESLHQQQLGPPGGAIPRSVLVANVLPDVPPTLFIAMADGTVVTFSFDPSKNTLSGMTKILLGTEPVFFKLLPRDSDTHSGLSNVFASCEQPSLIYSSEGRIVYSAVNSDKVSRVCYFNSAPYPGAIAIATPVDLKLAMIGRERATQLQTLPIGQTVRCLAYEPKVQLFGMGCIRRIIEGSMEALLSSFKIADQISFKELDSRELRDQELVECIISTGEFETDDENYDGMFVVGTSIAASDEMEDDEVRGRILVFEVNREKKIKLVTETSVKGACRSLAMCDGKIVAGLVKTVVLYALVPSTTRGKHTLELSKLASYRTSTNPLSLSVTPSTIENRATIAVADLMKSLSIVEVRPPDSTNVLWGLKELSRHFATVWSSATAVTGENEWVVADMEGNLAIMKRNLEGVTADDKKRLQVTGEFRLGEIVNKIVPIYAPGSASASLSGKGKERSRTLSSTANPMLASMDVDGPMRTGPIVLPRAFLATVEGAIYMLGTINASYTDALLRLQSSIASMVLAPGYMPWTKFRAWKTEVSEKDEPFRFVDGEMVEQGLLRLSDADLEGVLREAGLTEGTSKVTIEEVRAWGEELRRLY